MCRFDAFIHNVCIQTTCSMGVLCHSFVYPTPDLRMFLQNILSKH